MGIKRRCAYCGELYNLVYLNQTCCSNTCANGKWMEEREFGELEPYPTSCIKSSTVVYELKH